MRISTTQLYDSGTAGILRNQYDAYRLQNQLSTGRRVVTPADDPVAAAQSLVAEQKKSVNSQYLKNQGSANDQLGNLDNQLSSISGLLISAKSRWVEAGNGSYDDSQLKALAVDLRGTYQQILGIANSADATGMYVFSGYQGGTQPFVDTGSGVTYQGDSGARQLQVEASRFMDVSFSGQDLFAAVPQGNGTFVAQAASANTGSGVISNGSTLGNFDGVAHSIVFDSPTSYQIDGGTSTPYTPGAAITVGGAQVAISGSPATGDTFSVNPSGQESIFTTLNTFISTLENGNSGTDADKARFQNAMLRVGASLDQAISHINDKRAEVGARMNELSSLTSLGQDMDLQYQTQISGLVDLDYASAISSLFKNRLQLQAAEQSFSKVTSLSLFNYL